MTRRRPRPPPPLDDRDLAAEVLYLHSLWRRGPPAPAPVPVTAAAAVPNQSGTARRRADKRKRRRLGRGAAEPEYTGPDRPLSPSPPASHDAFSPEELTPPSSAHPAAQEEAISNCDPVPSPSTRRKANKRKRHGLECDAGSERPLAPSPPTADNAWPDGSTSSSPLKPPPPPSPGSLAHRKALRAAEEFFANHGSDDDEEVSETEGEEEEAAGFLTGLFERDAALRGHYERGWEEGQFACMACAGRKARKGKSRRFRGCVGLVQHARAATRYGRPGAHRALAAVVCRVLGWDVERLPSIVIDPRGTLGQALAARALSDAPQPKEDVETEVEGSNTNGDQVANELVTSKESAGMKDVEEIGPLNCEDGPKNIVYDHEINQKDNANKDDSLSQDNNGVCHEHDIAIESTEKEDTTDTCSNDTCENDRHCIKASFQEEENVGENKRAC